MLFLPPYPPELNPIEHTWSALKRKVTGCIHLYGSVSQTQDAVLEGNQIYREDFKTGFKEAFSAMTDVFLHELVKA